MATTHETYDHLPSVATTTGDLNPGIISRLIFLCCHTTAYHFFCLFTSKTSFEMARDEELAELAHPDYWNERYSLEKTIKQGETQEVLGSFEWFGDFAKLRAFFVKHLPASSCGSHILQLGCGNSVCFPFTPPNKTFYWPGQRNSND